MPTGFDHIVIAVNDLDQATANYTSAGFTVTPGGEHKGGLSHNVLVTFADGAYFEIIAFRNDGENHGTHWPTLLKQGEGLVDYALRTDDLAEEVAELRSRGLAYADPLDGGRFRPDGKRIDWQTTRFGERSEPSFLPFYCHDITERTLRVPDGETTVHANGVKGVAGIRVVVEDLATADEKFAALTGHDGVEVEPTSESVAAARRYQLGTDRWIEIVRPTDEDSPFRQYLETRGPIPYEVVLIAENGTGELLNEAVTHGARLLIQSQA